MTGEVKVRPIRTEGDYQIALKRAEDLMDAEAGTPDVDELEVLALLIESYEEKYYPIDTVHARAQGDDGTCVRCGSAPRNAVTAPPAPVASPAPEVPDGQKVDGQAFLLMRERISAVREEHRRKMNAASGRAEMAASIEDMNEVSISSTESERHREAFVALNVAIGIIDQTEYCSWDLPAPPAPVASHEPESVENPAPPAELAKDFRVVSSSAPPPEPAKAEVVKAALIASPEFWSGLQKMRNGAWSEGRFADAIAGVLSALATPPTAPAAARSAAEEMPSAWRDVLAERRRQVCVEGWTPEHDDQHGDWSLALAAACYAEAPSWRSRVEVITDDVSGGRGDGPVWRHRKVLVPVMWPHSWDARCWKPSADRRRNLVKAGGLILAEIERLDRRSGALPLPEKLEG